MPSPRISVRLSDVLYSALRQRAADDGLSRSQAVTQAVQCWLESKADQREYSEPRRGLTSLPVPPPRPSAATHTFKPQSKNALRCDTCGGKRGDHR